VEVVAADPVGALEVGVSDRAAEEAAAREDVAVEQVEPPRRRPLLAAAEKGRVSWTRTRTRTTRTTTRTTRRRSTPGPEKAADKGGATRS